MLLDSFSLLNWLRSAIEISSRPGILVNRAVVRSLSSSYETLRFIHSGPSRISDLERRLAASEQQATAAKLIPVLGALSIGDYQSVPTEILSVSPNLIIANHSFESGQIVITPEGSLVGVTSQIGKWSAKVRFISDSGSQFQIKIVANGEEVASGTLIGQFGGNIFAEKILTQIDLQPGQKVITSGSDDLVPANILVGWIGQDISREESSVYQRASVEPAAKIKSSDLVLVIDPK